MNKLTGKPLCNVFSYLPLEYRCEVLSNVSVRWRKYCRHRILWNDIDFAASASGLKHSAKQLVKLHASYVRRVDLGKVHLDDGLIHQICRCGTLNVLVVRFGWTDKRLAKLIAGISNPSSTLDTLSISGPKLTSAGESR